MWSQKIRICCDQGNRESKRAGKWHFSEVVGIFSLSWVTAKCDYLNCAGKVEPLHKPVFIRCCLLWWCFADVLDHTPQCRLSPAFCHPPTRFGCSAPDFHCGSTRNGRIAAIDSLTLQKIWESQTIRLWDNETFEFSPWESSPGYVQTTLSSAFQLSWRKLYRSLLFQGWLFLFRIALNPFIHYIIAL